MTITSIPSFSGIKGGFRAGCRDVYFIRCIGCSNAYIAEIQEMDRQWTEWQERGRGRYLRIKELPRLRGREEAERYGAMLEKWEKAPEEGILLEGSDENGLLRLVLSEGLAEIRELFRRYTPDASKTMERNFLIKMLFWTERLAGNFLREWDEKTSRKFVYSGTVKTQEYLFCYYLSLLGSDVMLLLPAGEPELAAGLKELSIGARLGEIRPIDIPPYTARTEERTMPQAASCGAERVVSIARPERKKEPARNRPSAPQQEAVPRPAGDAGRELGFEELAKLASSVVMIAVHDREGEVVCTGSGIMIGKDGYILTNHHVAGKGVTYSIRIEDDETIYETDELIKYNHFQDLAVIRIDRKLEPIPLYRGQRPLARGQKVVAIGSPLGLFNSVSDGIISGFRKIGDVDMIQFTAPISSGSSGGALLNMQGEVIGISTAGYDSGQNINLAVEYGAIAAFVRGFV